MFFITNIENYGDDTKYTIYDAKTDSTTAVFSNYLSYLYNSKGFRPVNEEVIKNNYSGIIRDHSRQLNNFFILTAIIDGDRYKIATQEGNTTVIWRDKIIELTREGRMANCTINKYQTNIECSDNIWQATTNEEFKRYIEDEHKKYNAKSKLLGRECNFYIDTVGEEARLLSCHGESEHIIIPNFVTTIQREVFKDEGIKSISLNNGLKYIGEGAFADCKLDSIDVPDTVKHIFGSALRGNKDFYSKIDLKSREQRIINRDKVKISDKTLLI